MEEFGCSCGSSLKFTMAARMGPLSCVVAFKEEDTVRVKRGRSGG